MGHSEHQPAGNGKVRDRPNTLIAVIVAFLVATVAAVVVIRLWLDSGEDSTFPLWLALTYAVLPYLAVFLPLLFRAMKRRRSERKSRGA